MRTGTLEPKVTNSQELIVPSLLVTLGYMEDTDRTSPGDFAKRLNEICDDMGIPPKGKNRQATFAQLMKVSQKGARKWLEGEGMPTLQRCIQIAQWAGVAVEWLVTGRGEKRPKSLSVDTYSNRVLAAMQPLPDNLKQAAAAQVESLRDAVRNESPKAK